MKIALCGPPHSGKSVLRHRLKAALQALAPKIHPYVLSTNPDGEGAWFQEAYQHNPEHARASKQSAKQPWTPAHAELYASWVRNATTPLTLIDLGGVIDNYSRQICAAATHAILLAPAENALQPWRDFSRECSLLVLAELLSLYENPADTITSTATPFRAAVHRLERGDLQSPRPAIEALAVHILSQLNTHPSPPPGPSQT